LKETVEMRKEKRRKPKGDHRAWESCFITFQRWLANFI
jgi:hypothetical protein